WRLPLLRARTKLESALSREAAFLYNNLLLVALCLTVLWGVIFPILTELFLGQSRTIGRPYYDFFLRIFGLPLLLLMGIGPLIAWRRASVRALLKTLRWPIAAALVAGAALIAAGAGSSRPGLIAYTFSAFVLATIVVELVRGTRVAGSLLQLSGVNQYFTGDTSREVGIHTDWLRAEDTYVIFDQQQGKYVYFKVLIKPLVNLIWLAGFVFLAGSLVALWPDAREQRRLVARLALARG